MRSLVPFMLAVRLVAGPSAALAQDNVDPADAGAQFAWSENAGWVNAEPSGDGGPGVNVTNAALTGWIWHENLGWISLSCQNTSSCAANAYQVANDGAGKLSGFAWGENVGWIDFQPNVGGTPVANAGVKIDPDTGVFSGLAWGENVGWMNFDFADLGSAAFQVLTSSRADTPSATPTATGTITPSVTATATRTSAGNSSTPTPSATAVATVLAAPGASPLPLLALVFSALAAQVWKRLRLSRGRVLPNRR